MFFYIFYLCDISLLVFVVIFIIQICCKNLYIIKKMLINYNFEALGYLLERGKDIWILL